MTKLKLEAGKYYRTRDGRKVGPLEDAGYGLMGVGGRAQYYTRASSVFKEEGRTRSWGESPDDIISEWSDTPSLKVGDKVRVVACETCHCFKIGEIVTLVRLETTSGHMFEDSNGFRNWMTDDEYEPTTTIGTLAEIGAQVGDVVEWLEIGSKHEVLGIEIIPVGRFMAGKADAILSGYGKGIFGKEQTFRIISRASDQAMIDRVMEATQGPVITETVKRIVPGVYGKVRVDVRGDDVLVGLDRSHMDTKWVANGTFMQVISRADLTAAIATLTAIRDAL